MRQPSNPRRARTRGNGKRHPSSKNYPIESNGPDVKIRGTAQQVMDKYLALARDAASAGDRVAAESYFQHADHYYRIVHSFDNGTESVGGRRGRGPRQDQSGDGPQPDVGEYPEANLRDGNGQQQASDDSDNDGDGDGDDDGGVNDDRDNERVQA